MIKEELHNIELGELWLRQSELTIENAFSFKKNSAS